jgi:hypothetical protein
MAKELFVEEKQAAADKGGSKRWSPMIKYKL